MSKVNANKVLKAGIQKTDKTKVQSKGTKKALFTNKEQIHKPNKSNLQQNEATKINKEQLTKTNKQNTLPKGTKKELFVNKEELNKTNKSNLLPEGTKKEISINKEELNKTGKNNLQQNEATKINKKQLNKTGNTQIIAKDAIEIKNGVSKDGIEYTKTVEGNITTIKYADGKTVVKKTNKNGELVEKKVSTGEGDEAKTTVTEYKDGKAAIKTSTQGTGDNIRVTSKKYDTETGKILQKTTTAGVGANMQKSTVDYDYNEDGTLAKRTQKNSSGSTRTTVYGDYKTNADGVTTRMATVIKTNGDKTTNFVSNQTLNKDGKLASYVNVNNEGKETARGTYTYENNKIVSKQRVITNDDGSVKTINYSNFKNTQGGLEARDVEVVVTDKDGKTTCTTKKIQLRNLDNTINTQIADNKINFYNYDNNGVKSTSTFDYLEGKTSISDYNKSILNNFTSIITAWFNAFLIADNAQDEQVSSFMQIAENFISANKGENLEFKA